MNIQIISKIKISKKVKYVIISTTIILGVFLRFYAMKRGHNFDFDSYRIVGDLVKNGANVYAETNRYNYGPIWFSILGVFKLIAGLFGNPDLIFRLLIVSLLTVVDLVVALILRKKYGLLAFLLFFLNPVSIIITGYHNQFDNLAILIGLFGLLLLPKYDSKVLERGHVYSALLIGLSLMTKHIFFMLPLWIFIRCANIRIKLFMFIVPIIIFIVGFLPFWSVGHGGIINNVFMYKSFANSPLIHSLLSPGLVALINPTILFVAALTIAGFVVRKLPALESGLWYLVVIVVFSPAIANQYLAIAMPAVVTLGFFFFIPFMVFAVFLLAGTSIEGLNVQKVIDFIPDRLLPFVTPHGANSQYNLIIFCLFIGMVLAAVYRYRRKWYVTVYEKIKYELKIQINSLLKR